MSTRESSDLPNLERDLPTTPEDIEALRKNRPVADPNWVDQLQAMIDQMPPEVVREALRRRKTFEGCEPFEL